MSLPETAPEAEPSLFPEGGIDSLRFAVVDLETRNVCAGPGAVIEVGIALMERGEITEARIDESVRRILRVKYARSAWPRYVR